MEEQEIGWCDGTATSGGLPRDCGEGTPKLRREWRVKIGEAGTSPEVGKGGSKDRTGEWGCTAVVEEGAGAQ